MAGPAGASGHASRWPGEHGRRPGASEAPLWTRGTGVLDNVEPLPQSGQSPGAAAGSSGTGSAAQVLWQRPEQRGSGQAASTDRPGIKGALNKSSSQGRGDGGVLWRRDATAAPSALTFPSDSTPALNIREGDVWQAPLQEQEAAAASGELTAEDWVRLHARLQARGGGEDPWRDEAGGGDAVHSNGRSAAADTDSALLRQDSAGAMQGEASRRKRMEPAISHAGNGPGIRGPPWGRDQAALHNNVEYVAAAPPPPPPPV